LSERIEELLTIGERADDEIVNARDGDALLLGPAAESRRVRAPGLGASKNGSVREYEGYRACPLLLRVVGYLPVHAAIPRTARI
jgi:hypothetical protein